jgi:predicted TIM-barrel fold metal-dependent hydrolase
MKSEVDNKPELQKYSRRDFMKKTALAAGAMGVAGSIGAGGLGMARLAHAEKNANGGAGMTPFKIDVHHHSVPDMYVKELESKNYVPSHGAGYPTWTPEASLDVMDQNGIAAAVTSISSPGVYIVDEAHAIDFSRRLNVYSAKMVQQHPDRFGFFAILPMPIVDASIKEAAYALDTLNADGVVLLASAGDRFLGDQDFEELMAELDRRKCVVFIHPNIHSTSDKLPLNIPGFFIEFMFDTTRAVTNLVFSGVMERYPNIKWIVAHAGATVPYLAWRLSLADILPDTPYAKTMPKGALAYLKKLYYDTALSPSAYAMASLLQLVEPTQILFGSDFPFAPRDLVAKEVNDLNELSVFDDEIRQMVYRDNALKLFPRFAK